MSERDPLDDLRAAWRELGPPAPDGDAGTDALVEDLRDAWAEVTAPDADDDPATDALTDDLRAAWARLDVPDANAASLHRVLRQRARFRRVRKRLVVAAAALLLCALVFALNRGFDPFARSQDQVATHEPGDGASERGAQGADAAANAGADAAARARRLDDSVRARVLPSGTLELRTGRVRLLLSDSATTTVHESNDDTTDSPALPADERR